jgi:hypothetical protein
MRQYIPTDVTEAKSLRVIGPVIAQTIQLCLSHYWALNDWERSFIDSLADQPPYVGVTKRQLNCLGRALRKVGAAR